MLRLEMEDGTVREIEAIRVDLDETGVHFYNPEIKCPECVTYDLIKKIQYEQVVGEKMKLRSKELQFSQSDRPRPGRPNTTRQLG